MSYSKITSANLCKPIHDIKIIPLPFVLLNLAGIEKNGKKIQTFEYLENEWSFFNEVKNIFIVSEGLSLGEKIKKLIKNGRYKL